MRTSRTPALYLHIGHDKTGSSFLQSTLALNGEVLKASGIYYPSVGNLSKAQQGYISNGNWAAFNEAASAIAGTPPECRATLFSSEGIFSRLSAARNFTRFTNLVRDLGIPRVNVLLFIRDPIDHISSEYQQKIKRGGEHQFSIDDYSTSYHMPERVHRLMDLIEGEPVFDLTVVNYSRAKGDITEPFAEWLGLPTNGLKTLPDQTVNRSLTPDELYIQRRLNMTLGKSGELIADRLCNLLPQMEVALNPPSPAAQRAMLSRLREHIAAVNARVDTAHAYKLDIVETCDSAADGVVQLSEAQVDVVIDGLAEEIARLRQTNTELREAVREGRGLRKVRAAAQRRRKAPRSFAKRILDRFKHV